MKLKIICCVATLVLILSASAIAAPEMPTLTIDTYPIVDGATAMLPLSYSLMQAVTNVSFDEAQNEIRHSKSTEAYYALVSGQAELLLTYAPSSEAKSYAAEMDIELEMAPIGIDALVFITNTENTISSITPSQAKDIFTGKITNWKDLGGDDIPIRCFLRSQTTASHSLLDDLVLKGKKPLKVSENSTGELDDTVVDLLSYSNEGASISYSSYNFVSMLLDMEGFKLLSVSDISPSYDTIKDNSYPLATPFFAVIRKDSPEDSSARKLYDWLISGQANSIIESSGYVSTKAK